MSIFPSQLLPDLDLDDSGRTGDAPEIGLIELIGLPALATFALGVLFSHKTATLVGAIWGLFNALSRTREATVLDDPFGEMTIIQY